MKARLKQHAAPGLIALALLVNTSAFAIPLLAPDVRSSPVQTSVPTGASTPRLAWDRVGAPMQAVT